VIPLHGAHFVIFHVEISCKVRRFEGMDRALRV